MLRWPLDAGARPDPVAAMEQALAATAGGEGRVRAYVQRHPDILLRGQAEAAAARWAAGRPLSPIDGMPVGVKDIIETADLPTRLGSPVRALWQAPARDAAAVRALRRAGAIVTGKTVTTEFAIGRSGPTTNPHDPARSPGGSSSGSAAGVAAGFFAAALGSQTQGSVIRPATYCGTWGYKPSHGLLPMGGVHPLSPSQDDLGILAAGLAECRMLAALLSGGPGQAAPALELRPPRRLLFLRTAGWDEPGWDQPEGNDAALAAFLDLLAALRRAGIAVLDPRDPASGPTDGEALRDAAAFERDLIAAAPGSLDILAWEMAWPFAEMAERHGAAIGPRIHDLLAQGARLDRAAYAARLADRDRLRARFHALTAGHGLDAAILPAASGVAPLGLAHTGSRTCQMACSWLGLPAISMPLLRVAGLPLGVQLAGPAGGDSALFDTAAAIGAALT